MLTAVYDLAVSPPTFDFVGFLVSAERERLKRGEKHLRVLIAPGPDHGFRRDHLPPRDPAVRRRMLENIVIPMCSLLPSCVSVEEWDAEHITHADFPVSWLPRHRVPHYGTDKLVQAFKADCYPLTSGETAKDQHLITITLREAGYHPTRDSNVKAWHALADHLERRGYEARIIGDGMLQNSFDRGRIYERAKLNLFVNSGPSGMAMCMRNAHCLVFKMVSDAICCNPGFFESCGLPVGSQIGRANHRIVWHDDDEQTLISQTMAELDSELAAAY